MAVHEIYVDGACRQGKGSAAAVVIKRNNLTIGSYARGLGITTSTQAEYEAIILGLVMAWSANLADPIIYTDCNTAHKHITGAWQCRNQGLIPLLRSIQHISSDYRFRVVHVNRREVNEPDMLANQFLDDLDLN